MKKYLKGIKTALDALERVGYLSHNEKVLTDRKIRHIIFILQR